MTAPRCEPPAEHRGKRWHWVSDGGGRMEVWEWIATKWYRTGLPPPYYPAFAGEDGWRYVAPAIPPAREGDDGR